MYAQFFDLNANKKRVTIPFRLTRNLLVIKLKINDKGPFNFVVDTGVGLMIITDPKLVDSINLVNKRTIKLPGLGEGEDYEAYITSPLRVEIPGLTSYDVSAAILKKDHFGLSNFAGMPIHGLLGYEFFNNLAVKINFSDSTLTVYRSKDAPTLKKGNRIPLTIEDRKPYMTSNITLMSGVEMKCKLIVDLGAGHPVSLENVIKKYGMPQKFIAANLGIGLNGPINGFISRIKEVNVGKYKIKDVITSFPTEDISRKLSIPRDGSLGLGILKKFTIVINYPDSVMYFKAISNLKEPFEHDMSGMEYYTGGTDYNHVIISRVEPGSPADEIGIEKDDEITSINFKAVATMTLEEIDNIFKSKDDRSLLLEIFHDHKYDRVILTLKRRI